MANYRDERYDTMYSSHPVLDRIPGRGITKEEHDRHVAGTGRNYTDPIPITNRHSGSDANVRAERLITAKRPTTRLTAKMASK